MAFRIAALLGRTVEELHQTMTSVEFTDWCAFYSLEPWGFDSDNWRMGVIGATVANYSGRVKKAVKPSDFFPKAPRKLSPKEARQLLKEQAKNG